MTIKTTIAVTAATVLALTLAGCGSSGLTGTVTNDTPFDSTDNSTEDGYTDDQFDSDTALEALGAAWDMYDEQAKILFCDTWNDPSITHQEIIDAFNTGANGQINDADITTFFNRVC